MITSFAYQKASKSLVPVDQVEERDGKYYDKESGEELTQVIAKMSKSLKNVPRHWKGPAPPALRAAGPRGERRAFLVAFLIGNGGLSIEFQPRRVYL